MRETPYEKKFRFTCLFGSIKDDNLEEVKLWYQLPQVKRKAQALRIIALWARALNAKRILRFMA